MGLQYKEGICTCHNEKNLIVKKLPGRKLCHGGNQERLAERKSVVVDKPTTIAKKGLKRKKAYVYKKTATGEGILFEAIWTSRPHISFLNKEPLGQDAYAWFFAHVLRKAKGFWPEFKLYDYNIILLTRKQHELYDQYVNSPEILIDLDPLWKRVFDLRKELLKEYKDQFSCPNL